MKWVLPVLCLSLLSSTSIPAQEKTSATANPRATGAASEARGSANPAAGKLPVRRVVLYKNGVGYFEHLGRVHSSQDVHVDFTSAQLNDVLKSLTVLDLSGGKITGVGYNSEAPLARRLATLRLALGEKPTTAEFLSALRGARLEVRGGNNPAMTGKLLSVERKTQNGSNWTVETDEISLITDGGEIRSVDINPITSVRIAEKDLQVEVGKYLGLIASSRDQDVRRMTISTTGAGERNLYVSYISEVPIWKTTYRIVLPSKPEKNPLLQGWAIVDNTIGEDWNEVELSLVAGAPHSFIQELSQPYYGRRPVVPLPESVQLTPQTHAATLEAMPRLVSPHVMGGVPGGVAGGSMGGVIGGVIGGMGGAPPPPKPKLSGPLKVGGNVQAARIINKIQPLYPPLARQTRISGTVRLHAIIGKDGTIQSLEVLNGHPLLQQAALDAVRQWRYQPTLLNGEPVDVDTTIDVIFTLNQ